jgi:hypothetical protein
MTQTRREFLKVLGGMAGAVVLSSCDLSSNSNSPLPNAYSFFRLFSTGGMLPEAGKAEFIPPFVKIHEKNQIIFHAGDTFQRNRDGLSMGLYELVMDYSAFSPRIEGFHKIVRADDQLNDGGKVFQVQLADLNKHGSVAVRLLTEGDVSQSIYLEQNRTGGGSANGLQRVVGYHTDTPDGDNVFGAVIGNFDLHENDDMLVAAHWAAKTGSLNGESLFHLPGGVVDANGRAIIHAGNMLPDSGHLINKLGLINGYHAGGEYTLQVHTDSGNVGGANQARGSAVIKGDLSDNSASSASLIAASSDIALSTAARVQTRSTRGAIHFGPRINADGNVATVTHITDRTMLLTLGNDEIIQTGDTTPLGRVVSGIGGPVLGADGLVFFVAASEGKEELLVSNGSHTATILETGRQFFGDNGPTLLTIAFGYAKEQADNEGRLVFIGEFDDGTLSVMLGVPL